MKWIHIPYLALLFFVVSSFLFPAGVHALVFDPRSHIYLRFTGTVNGLIVAEDMPVCGHPQPGFPYEIQMRGSINGAPYFFNLTIYDYSGPGTYTQAFIALGDLKGRRGWATHLGRVTTIGTVLGGISATTLTDTTTNTQVQVSGNWNCGQILRLV
jgi:hypothetical protein